MASPKLCLKACSMREECLSLDPLQVEIVGGHQGYPVGPYVRFEPGKPLLPIGGRDRSSQGPLKLAPPVRPSLKRRNKLHRPILHSPRPAPEVSTATSTSVDSPENQAQICLQNLVRSATDRS